MEWIVKPNNNDGNGPCPKSACAINSCPSVFECPKDTRFCAIEFSGPDCPSRSCFIYILE